MSLSPAQVNFVANVEPFRSAMAAMVQAVNASAPQIRELTELLQWIQRDELRRHIHMQYRRKSRGHR